MTNKNRIADQVANQVATCELPAARNRVVRFAPRTPARRGILLLVVLSILTLFLLIGTAFIVSANHYRDLNKTLKKTTETSNSSIDQGNLLNEVINQLVRDTNNQDSVLRYHSLLRDMYGNDGILAQVNNAEWASVDPTDSDPLISNPTSGQMLQFTLYNINDTTLRNITDQFGNPIALSTIDNAYNGLVLTFLDGPARGQSVRIVGYVPVETTPGVYNAVLRVLTPTKANGAVVTMTDFAKLNSSRFLINGRPFNGTGVGYNPLAAVGAPKLNINEEYLSGVAREFALLPNGAFQRLDWDPLILTDAEVSELRNSIDDQYHLTQQQLDYLATITDPRENDLEAIRLKKLRGTPGLGGSDESYDAADYQNMSLALLPAVSRSMLQPTETVFPNLGAPGSSFRASFPTDLGGMILPSFHRPALLNYWHQQLITAGGTLLENDPNLLRKVLLRPNWLDHPNFTGSNPDVAKVDVNDHEGKLLRSIYGPWDVDNDNDGVRDSVWVDFGAPVIENSDGRLVKPLAALLVLDMDGRLNLNAHGSEDIASSPSFGRLLAGGTSSDTIAQGQGYGPAEISLASVLDDTFWGRMIRGGIAGDEVHLEDSTGFPAVASPDRRRFRRRRAGKFGGTDMLPGKPNQFDLSAQMKMQGVPMWADGRLLDASGSPTILGGYATPPDLRGRYALGLNQWGQPEYEALDVLDLDGDSFYYDSLAPLNLDSPYEIDLSLGAARGESVSADDGPFAMAEMERILRVYDADAGDLPSRLWDFAGEFKTRSDDITPDLENINKWRTALTTDSFDLPVPNVVVPKWMVAGGAGFYSDVMGKPAAGATSFADLLEYRIRTAQSPVWLKADDTPSRLLLIRQEMRKLLPHDLADGLRLDINRPIGNGRDDNDNGVVDEPGEWDDADGNHAYDGELEAAFWTSADRRLDSFTGNDGTSFGKFHDDAILFRNTPADYDGGGDHDGDGDHDRVDDVIDFWSTRGITGAIDTHEELVTIHNFRRQMLARDLYVLAMTLVDPVPLPTSGSLTEPEYVKKKADQARRLAQWAINVVDFRDPDNIMTAFEYDANPFDGWAPDGSLATRNDIYGTDAKFGGAVGTPSEDQGGLVWGAERPELLITETTGWHDRATENTNKEDPANSEGTEANPRDDDINDDDIGTVPTFADENAKLPDSDYDQRLRPKGAAFVELYCPWPENPATNADLHEIDVATGADLGVNIAATDPSGNSPVWRLMMYQDGGPGKNPDSADKTLRPLLPDRSVYFAGFDPNYPAPTRYSDITRAHPEASDAERFVNDGVAFFNSLTVQTVRPGGYMVVGAGEPDGSGEYVSKLSSPTESVAYTDQGISLNPSANRVELRNNSGGIVTDAAGFPVGANAAIAIINQVNGGIERRFTFSEPANGYPDRVEGSVWDPGRGLEGAYVPTLDIPLDDQRALFERPTEFTVPVGTGGFLQSKKRSELNDGEIRLTLPGFRQGTGFNKSVLPPGGVGRDIEEASRTIPGFKWVYLQRLANPLLPWNPEPLLPDGTTMTPGYNSALAVNPYMTIDSMGANVTVFTGVSPEERRVNPAKPRDPILRFRNRIPVDTLASVQRGRDNAPTSPVSPASLLELQSRLAQRPDSRIIGVLKSGKSSVERMNLWNPEPIGYVDEASFQVAGLWKNEAGSAGNGISGTSNNFNGIPDNTLGFLNEPYRAAGSDPNNPKSPFPWFTWNNRPFANGAELIHVPAFSASRLLESFSMRDDGGPTADPAKERYTNALDINHQRKLHSSGVDWEELLDLQTDGSFGHLLNFFRTGNFDTGTAMPLEPEQAGIAGLHRLLDYIHVPSRFVGTETWLNPENFGDDPTIPADDVTSTDDPRYLRQPPFNRIDEYREPGRVNLNTVVNEDVYQGMMHGDTSPTATGAVHPGPNWNDLTASRRGYGTGGLLELNDDSPTFFVNPIRSPDAGDLVPLVPMIRDSAESTMFRSNAIDGIRTTDNYPLFAAEMESHHNHADRNSYFRYQPITRLSSMTTTRSNVYAVWVTVGFFEVTEAPAWPNGEYPDGTTATVRFDGNRALYDRVYPEGYMLGQEAGSDTGDIRRVREFAVIDRTVPVAFEPGQNHNVDKAIRLRRRID